MAKISNLLEIIKNSLYGSEMRTALHDSIRDVNADLEHLKSRPEEVFVSGENFKTINDESILGAGNIKISGGGSVEMAWGGLGFAIGTIDNTDRYYATSINNGKNISQVAGLYSSFKVEYDGVYKLQFYFHLKATTQSTYDAVTVRLYDETTQQYNTVSAFPIYTNSGYQMYSSTGFATLNKNGLYRLSLKCSASSSVSVLSSSSAATGSIVKM